MSIVEPEAAADENGSATTGDANAFDEPEPEADENGSATTGDANAFDEPEPEADYEVTESDS